jgi:single-stranded DNA-binding protein
MNRVVLAGRLCRDVTEAKSGKCAWGTIATEVGYDREKKEQKVEFVPFTAFGLTSAQLNAFRKGTPVVIEGRVQNRKREKDGEDVWETSIVVSKAGIKLLANKREAG